jgi:hypothetical protein
MAACANPGLSRVGAVVVCPTDMDQYVHLSSCKMKFSQKFDGITESVENLSSQISDIFEEIKIINNKILICDGIVEVLVSNNSVWVTWYASPTADVVADTIALLLMNLKDDEGCRRLEIKNIKNIEFTKLVNIIKDLIEASFGSVIEESSDGLLTVQSFDKKSRVKVDVQNRTACIIDGPEEASQSVMELITNAFNTLEPISLK